MPFDTRYRNSASLMFPPFPRGVKGLIIANVAIFLIYFFGSMMTDRPLFLSFNLMPWAVTHQFAVWQLVTYMFLHAGITHILFNMLALWMFGSAIESTWGTRRFLQYYFICGVGAGICVVLANLAFGDPYQRVIGASGAIYGLLLAFGMLFPEQEILFIIFPIKAKYMVMIFGAIAFLGSFQTNSTVSNLAHLGGMLVGYIYIRQQFASRRSRLVKQPFSVSAWWRDYKRQRAKKKFQVYMKRHGSDKGPWVN
jgi:membrane associated rhomboid family serine protease